MVKFYFTFFRSLDNNDNTIHFVKFGDFKSSRTKDSFYNRFYNGGYSTHNPCLIFGKNFIELSMRKTSKQTVNHGTILSKIFKLNNDIKQVNDTEWYIVDIDIYNSLVQFINDLPKNKTDNARRISIEDVKSIFIIIKKDNSLDPDNFINNYF